MQVLVVGAGVVGLAVARAAALAGHEVIVAEAERGIGMITSSRNSEVIHAGMYYPTATLRAAHCVRGRHMLYDFLASHGVPHRKCGKLIVATNEPELKKIEQILAQGRINDVEGLELIGANAARDMEPALACIGALWSPETGIIDGHAYMLALRGDLEDHSGMIAFSTPVQRLTPENGGWTVHYGGADPGSFQVDAVINCAGLGAQRLAAHTDGYPPERVPRLVYGKGNYFFYPGKAPFSRLIYPTPIEGGLGIHVTLDLSGRMRFGPDVEWVETENYEVDVRRADIFYDRIRTYWPDLPEGSLQADYSGIRPKLSGKGEGQADFLIEGPQAHGLPRLVNLFGIESPGLTSSLSLGELAVGYLT
jgi:L-2-hydroxyglutarate oxidase LhgO